MSARTPATPAPHVLELRIHGVANTPAPSMLGLDPDQVERADGDALGGFWTPTAAALAQARASAGARWAGPLPGPGDWVPPDYVDPTVRREAYSWGAMARYSVRLPVGGTWAVRVARAAWLLLAPMGVTNAAYWSRRLVPDPAGALPGTAATAPGSATADRRYGRGRATTVLFGLGLTLVLVAALETVSLDLLATQCSSVACPGTPGWLHGLTELGWGRRLAVASLVPVAGVLVLLWLSAGSRVRYEMHASSVSAVAGAVPGRAVPILAQPDLWARWRLAERSTNAHVAASLALVAATLAWNRLFAGSSCGPARALAGSCADPVRARPLDAALLVAAVVLLAGAVLLLVVVPPSPVGARAEQARGARDGLVGFSSTWLVLAALVLATVDASLWFGPQGTAPPHLLGMTVVPDVLLGLMLLVALGGFTWRRGAWHSAFAWLGGAAVVVGTVATQATHRGAGHDARWPLLVTVAGFAVLLAVIAAGARRWAGNRYQTLAEVWWGGAPGVFLLLALGLQMALTSMLVVAVGDWLNGPALPACLLSPRPAGCPAGPTLPNAYADFVAGVAFLAPLMVVCALVPIARRAWRRLRFELPATVGGTVRQRAGSLRDLLADPRLVAAVTRARARADLLQRAESVLGALAFALAAAMALTVLVMPGRGPLVDTIAPALHEASTLGLWLLVAGWTYGILSVLTASGDQVRPAGLVWDLLCFLPRTAHPLGPPCYGERAVPELAARVDGWLVGEDLPPGSPQAARRQVVLSAHSLGAVLAVAALMAPTGRDLRTGRVALLTYGTQLRPYFGRFFPELFGQRALGVPAVRCAALSTPVWQEDRRCPVDTSQPATAPTLVDLLGGADRPRWRSLWRPTDPLGMQVAVPGVDRQAQEVDAAAYLADIGAHSGYPRVPAYRAAFEELADPPATPRPRRTCRHG